MDFWHNYIYQKVLLYKKEIIKVAPFFRDNKETKKQFTRRVKKEMKGYK